MCTKGLVETKTTCYHQDDGISMSIWAEHLKNEDSLLYFKRWCNPPPRDRNIDKDAFILMIQTPWQRERWKEFGGHFLGLDAMHNTMQFEGFQLFTLIARDLWGCGMSNCTSHTNSMPTAYRSSHRLDDRIKHQGGDDPPLFTRIQV